MKFSINALYLLKNWTISSKFTVIFQTIVISAKLNLEITFENFYKRNFRKQVG